MKVLFKCGLVLLMLVGVPISDRVSSGQAASICSELSPQDTNDVSAIAKWDLCKLSRAAGFGNGVRAGEVLKFYLPAEYSPAWTVNGRPTPQAAAMVQALQDAAAKGLRPEDYDAQAWNVRLAQLATGKSSGDDLAQFDFALTMASIRYVSHLHSGRGDPERLQFNLGGKNKYFDVAGFLRAHIVHASQVRQSLAGAEPTFLGYDRTLQALQTYLALAEKGDGPPVPQPARPLKPGDAYAGVPQLAQRLRLLGDLAPDAPLPPSGQVYEGVLVDAVKHLQSRHGLTSDGRISRETYEQLTTPLKSRVTQLQLALERWRWLPDDITFPLIAVNIPEFKLRAYDDHHISLAMRAIVGKATGHQTPVFADTLEYLIFHPSWNVPESIQHNELVPILRKNPAYLTKHQLEIVDDDGRVVATAVSPEMVRQLQAGRLGLRQRPGPANSLGLIKFVFPNRYSIYLHGTPEQQLFSHFRRDLSHGCIRVEDPAALAAWVLRDDPSWTPDRIAAAMSSPRSLTVKVRQIPVLIMYGTAFVEENGEVHFFQDIYGHDAALELALAETSKK